MKTLKDMNPPRILLTIVIISLCSIILQGMHTSAQPPSKSGEQIERRIQPAPATFSELTAQLEHASAEISKLKGRLNRFESRERDLLNNYRKMAGEISQLKDFTQKAVALTADDRKRRLKIEKINRLTGGRPEPKDMVVSINKFSITWNQMDAVLNKLDEITQTLSRP